MFMAKAKCREKTSEGKLGEASVDTEFYFQWHITERCNRRCRHCYHVSYDSRGELSDDALLGVADKLVAALKAWGRRGSIGLTGGEPWMRRDAVFGLLDRFGASDTIDHVDLMTNGTLLSVADCEQLVVRSLPLRRIQFSLEGASPAVHDAIRGIGSFEETIAAIRRSKQCGLTVAVMMTLSRQNMHEIVLLLDRLVDLGVDVFAIDRFIPEGQASSHTDWLLSASELKHCFETVHRWGIGHRQPRVLMYRPLFCLIDPESPYVGAMCSAGINALTILHDGAIYPCRRLPLLLGNVMTDSLFEVFYESPILWKVREPENLGGHCASCEYLPVCRGCRAMALAVTGDWLAQDPQCWL
jgi:radical SAM protein with 4Fe4S-binding SPASM domain